MVVGSTLAHSAQAIEHRTLTELPVPALRLSRSLGGSVALAQQALSVPPANNPPDIAAPDALPGLLASSANSALLVAQSDSNATVSVTPKATVTVTPREENPAPSPATGRALPAALPANRGSPSAPKDDEQAGKRYGLAPIRWGGQIAYTRSRFRSGDDSWSDANAYEITTQASSYVLAPWISLINGGLSLVLTESSSGSNADRNGTGSVGVAGNLGANIFPISRFPFSLELRATDSRTDASSFDRNRKTYRLSARQDYRPARGEWNAFGTYDFDRVQEADFGDDTVHRLAGGMRWQDDRQTFDSQGSVSRNSRDDGFSSDVALLTANHYRKLRPDLNLTSNASYLFDRRNAIGSPSSNQLQTLQAYSAANWNPLNSPWSLNASARVSLAKGDDGPLSESLSLSGGGNYRASRNLTYGAAVAVNTFTVGEGERQTVTTQFLSANYNGDPLNFGRLSYNWGLSTSASNVSGSQNSTQSLSASAYHSLNTYWQTGATSTVSASGSQGVSQTRSMGDDTLSTTSLNHSASLGYQLMPSASSQAMIGLSLTDSRTYGDRNSTFQLANLQINGNWITSQYSSLSGNMTLQRSWRSQDPLESEDPLANADPNDPFALDTTQDSDSNTSANGSITYLHGRAFGVRDLRYSLRFTAATSTTNEREFGDPNASRDQVSRILEQDLYYRIGRLDTQLRMRVAEVDGRKNALIFFRVSRSFGSF